MTNVKTVVEEAVGAIHPGACFGWYDNTEKSCNKCMIAQKCEDSTKSVMTGKTAEPSAPEEVEVEKIIADMSPMEYLFESMKSIDAAQKSTDKDGVTTNDFVKDGKTIMRAVVGKTGKVMFVSRKGKKVVDSLDSNERVDEVLKELL